ncbi:hypothetical protein HIM_10194 [Hirsutella minnesotensis 3608]|uniref:Uncharacterized protein n=1 Tax=Hirsutella minnesotensis 3608 TaxID=1043627 RepID=A0A0F7ZG80_9HYPO|nr:hypothetical protein HIM_10194 [Hirsutella minnesotensis 3608]
MAAYYNRITSQAEFHDAIEDQSHFDDICSDGTFASATSSWTARYLYAARAICKREAPSSTREFCPYISKLVQGPRPSYLKFGPAEIFKMPEHQPDLGATWVALAKLQPGALGTSTMSSERPRRLTA